MINLIKVSNFNFVKCANCKGLRVVLMLMLLMIGVGTVLGSSSTTYFMTAGAKSTGNGYVYVAASNTTPADGSITSTDMAVKGSNSSSGSSANITFSFGAKPVDGKVFLGWRETESASAPYTGEAAKFTISVPSSNSTDPGNPANTAAASIKRYAYFGDGVISPSTNLFAFNKSSGTFTVTYISGNAINLTSSNAKFTVSPSSIAAGSGTQTVTVTYTGSASGIDRTLIIISSSGLETQYVDVSSVESITSANASTFTFETGTKNSSTTHPYRPIASLGVSECFAGSTPAFDELYLFGTTLQRTNHAATSININNAVTPCYVYTKSGSTYVFSKVVNMNSDTKGIGVNVAANGQKLYFSGWCPYASSGYKLSDIGVFHISGSANKTVDIYLSNAYIYSRTKFNGHSKTDYEFRKDIASSIFDISLNTYVTEGSGGVFVFQTTSTTSSQPFKPNVHIRNTNYLMSTIGNYIHILASMASMDQTATQCSAPIHMLISSDSQYETLTIDDVWPAASGTIRTNGALQFAKGVNQSPSIDLGNGNSVVNFNGGRITLANAIPGSSSYTTSFAVSARQYSKSVSALTASVYGMGGDRTDGTINFNDGTFDVTPLTDAQYSSYSTLYHDKKSIKVPSTASINGGSYNCSVWKCADPAEIGASPTDKSGTSLCKLSLLKTGTKEHGFAEYTIPAAFKPGLDAYYAEKGWTYGENSIAADATDSVHLMLPCDLIDASAIISVENIPWVGILPEFQAGSSGITVDMGGDKTITSDETHVTNRLLYGRIDDYVANSLSGYTDPKYGSSVTLKSSDKNKNALNTSSYTISNNSYVLLPLVADQWFAFAAPFDVKKVSIIDAYPDALATAQSNAAALTSQAHSNLDLFCYIADAIDEESLFDIETTVNAWINCEKTERYPDVSTEIKNQFKKRELLPYTSVSATSDKNHFWLYENASNWTYNGKNFTGQTLITSKTDGLVMQKNKVYSMMFSSENVSTGDWKYWTGKYILIEGGEDCEIAGKSSQPSTSESYTSTTAAAVKGNHTLADIPAPASVGAFWGYDYSSGTYKHQTSKTNPTQAFFYTCATPSDGTPATLVAFRANGVCLYNITYSASTLQTIAAPEYGTYSVESVPTTKYFYDSGAWKKLDYDGEKDLYLCADNSHYYRYNESTNHWELAEYTLTWITDGDALTGSYTNGTVVYGTSIVAPNTPTKSGYAFNGWTPAVAATMPAGNATYTATWICVNPSDLSIASDGNKWDFCCGETMRLEVSGSDIATDATYQWKKWNGSSWDNISGATSATYNTTMAAAKAGQYCCTVTNGSCSKTSSDVWVRVWQLHLGDNDIDFTNTGAGTGSNTAVALSSDTHYEFKLKDNTNGWFGLNSKTIVGTELNVILNGTGANVNLTSGLAGNYTFAIDYSDRNNPKVSVTYPTADQPANRNIYFDKSVIADWGSDVYYRIGKSSHNTNNTETGGTAWTLVPGTDNFYTTQTMAYNGFEAWQIANNKSWSGDNSIYLVNGSGYEITKAINFQKYVVDASGITIIPTTSNNTENGCDYWNVNTSIGMLTHTATITPPSNGTITIANAAQSLSATTTTSSIPHRTILTITATPNPGYRCTSLTVNGAAFTSGNTYILSADATIAATFEEDGTGFYLDIIDVDNSEKKLKINVSGTEWPTAGWPYSIKVGDAEAVSYGQKSTSGLPNYRADDRTITVLYAGNAGDAVAISVKNTSGTTISLHTYVIPAEITSSTTLAADQSMPLFVKGTTLTINGNIATQNIYVGPDAKLVVNSGKTLTIDTLFLRTNPSSAAELVNNGTITGQVYYTRIISDKSGYKPFGLPLSCPIADVRLSNGNSVNYKTSSGWILRYYDENKRATTGPNDNWVTLSNTGADENKTIQAGKGYEMYSGVNYYREFYFPVDLSTLTNSVSVAYTAGEQSVNNGWNVLVSPLTKTLTLDPKPEDMTVNWMQPDGTFEQENPSSIPPAKIFAYQATKAGSIVFEGTSMTIPSIAPRRVMAMEEPTQIQWIHLDVEDANGVGDQTSIYSHPTRYDEVYQTGIDVAKQSLTASRAIIYSSHVYGDMAFAGVADSLLEQGVALTVYSPSAQELIISMRENEWLNRMEEVWLVDNETGMRVDLLWSDYAFRAPTGTTSGRLFIQGVFRAPQITTDIEPTSDSSLKGRDVRKVIINDKIYIIVNGRMFDSTGKLVLDK